MLKFSFKTRLTKIYLCFDFGLLQLEQVRQFLLVDVDGRQNRPDRLGLFRWRGRSIHERLAPMQLDQLALVLVVLVFGQIRIAAVQIIRR